MPEEKEIRPGEATKADPKEYKSSIPVAADSAMIARADALVVLVQDKAGRYRRRIYLSLRSAERAVDRARARGRDVEIVPAYIVPIAGDVDD